MLQDATDDRFGEAALQPRLPGEGRLWADHVASSHAVSDHLGAPERLGHVKNVCELREKKSFHHRDFRLSISKPELHDLLSRRRRAEIWAIGRGLRSPLKNKTYNQNSSGLDKLI